LGIATIRELLLDASPEVHWRGTITDRGMVHLAIQNADEHVIDVVWMDKLWMPNKATPCLLVTVK
jgi:hypothetical protein